MRFCVHLYNQGTLFLVDYRRDAFKPACDSASVFLTYVDVLYTSFLEGRSLAIAIFALQPEAEQPSSGAIYSSDEELNPNCLSRQRFFM